MTKNPYLTPLPDKDMKEIKFSVPRADWERLEALTKAFTDKGHSVDILEPLVKDFAKHLSAIEKLAKSQGIDVATRTVQASPLGGIESARA